MNVAHGTAYIYGPEDNIISFIERLVGGSKPEHQCFPMVRDVCPSLAEIRNDISTIINPHQSNHIKCAELYLDLCYSADASLIHPEYGDITLEDACIADGVTVHIRTSEYYGGFREILTCTKNGELSYKCASFEDKPYIEFPWFMRKLSIDEVLATVPMNAVLSSPALDPLIQAANLSITQDPDHPDEDIIVWEDKATFTHGGGTPIDAAIRSGRVKVYYCTGHFEQDKAIAWALHQAYKMMLNGQGGETPFRNEDLEMVFGQDDDSDIIPADDSESPANSEDNSLNPDEPEEYRIYIPSTDEEAALYDYLYGAKSCSDGEEYELPF